MYGVFFLEKLPQKSSIFGHGPLKNQTKNKKWKTLKSWMDCHKPRTG